VTDTVPALTAAEVADLLGRGLTDYVLARGRDRRARSAAHAPEHLAAYLARHGVHLVRTEPHQQ
jgi:hypothetical protein